MADVIGGGTTNVTLYDEDGALFGTPVVPMHSRLLGTSTSAISVVTLTVGAAPVRIDTGLTTRRSTLVRSRLTNAANSRVYLGFTAGATQTTALELLTGDAITLPVTETTQLFAFCVNSASTIEVVEVGS